MTDVDESVPLCTLSITPQTPGVTAGTGTVNTVPLAMLSITPQTPGFQRYPIFEVLDSNGNRIDSINFGNLEAGRESDPQVITLVNNSGSSVDVTLTATLGDDGTTTETVTSTLLSGDDTDYIITTDTFTVPANSSLPVYIKWRPPSTSRPGSKVWNLEPSGDISVLGWDYISTFTVTSNHTTDEYNVNIIVTIPYEAGKMQTDFDDIRFYENDYPLIYELLYKTDSTSATFLVQLPTLSATTPSNITVYSGNNSASSEGVTSLGVYDGFDDSALDTSLWTWIRESSGNWDEGTTSAGKLNMKTLNKELWSTNNNAPVLRGNTPLPANCELYCHLTLNPTANFRRGHLMVYGDDANYTGIGYGYNNGKNVNAVKEVAGSSTEYKLAADVSSLQVKIKKIGEVYYLYYDIGAGYVLYQTLTLSLGSTLYPALISQSYSSDGGTTNVLYDDFLLIHNPATVDPTVSALTTWTTNNPSINLIGGVVYSIPDLPELDLQNQYIINVGGVGYE